MDDRMAAELFKSPVVPALDADANPLSGARWYFYQSGGLIPQDVYTSDALTTPLPHPVVATADGKFAAIYLDPTKVYRGILKDADDNTIKDFDPINDTLWADLANGDGSAIVGFNNGETDAIDTTTQRKLREVKSAWDWAAYPDGVTSEAALLAAITDAWDAAVTGNFDLHFPDGVYDIGDASFPWRQASAPVALLDCQNVTIYGSGPDTIFKTTSAGGADVFQLNGVKNLHFRNLKIMADLTGFAGSGSNAISITGGYDNISILDVWMENLPAIDAGTFIDGGKALTIQCDTATLEVGSLKARIFAKGCSQGFGFESGLVNMLTKKVAVDVDVTAEDCFAAVSIGGAEALGVVPAGTHTGVRVRAQAINCQKDVQLTRAHGVQVDCQSVSTKTAAAKRLDPNGVAWIASETIVESLQCVYAKNSQIRVTGNAGLCDYRARIGGTNAGASGLSGATEYCDIFLDLAGTAATSDIAEVEVGGVSLANSFLSVTPTTGTIPAGFRLFSRNNQFPVEAKLSSMRGCLVKRTTDLTATNFTAGVTIGWDAEVYDTDEFHDNVTNNTRITIPSGVTKVRLSAAVRMANVTAGDNIYMQIRKNGSVTYDGAGENQGQSQLTIPRISASTAILTVTGGDYFEVLLQTNSDASADLTATQSWFCLEYFE